MPFRGAAALLLALSVLLVALPAAAAKRDQLLHGRYIFRISGCAGCHTREQDTQALAVDDSLVYLTAPDVTALISYIKSIPAQAN